MLELFETNPLGLVRASQAAHAAIKAVAWQKDRGYEVLDVFEQLSQNVVQVYKQASEHCWDRLASLAWAATRAPRSSTPRG